MIFGTAAAAASVFTVTRTSSEPARASSITWLTVATTSAVSVLVIDWTTIGLDPPTGTPPTLTATEARRFITAITLPKSPLYRGGLIQSLDMKRIRLCLLSGFVLMLSLGFVLTRSDAQPNTVK